MNHHHPPSLPGGVLDKGLGASEFNASRTMSFPSKLPQSCACLQPNFCHNTSFVLLMLISEGALFVLQVMNGHSDVESLRCLTCQLTDLAACSMYLTCLQVALTLFAIVQSCIKHTYKPPCCNCFMKYTRMQAFHQCVTPHTHIWHRLSH